ncbi:MAG: hypothetical protein ACJ796_02290 [Gemmatimonadaceae bacterium]
MSHPDVGQTYHCPAFDHAAVVVPNMRPAGQRSALAGDLFVKRMDALAPVPATPVMSVRRIVHRQKPSYPLVH